MHCRGRRPLYCPDAASVAPDQPVLWAQPHQHHPLHQDHRADGQLSDGKVCVVWLREGTSDRVSLDIKNVVAAAIKGGTDAVVLCHNHPNGVALPSLEDMDATGSIARALGLVNVHLLDHFILTDTEYFSMRDANRLPIYDFKTGTLFWP